MRNGRVWWTRNGKSLGASNLSSGNTDTCDLMHRSEYADSYVIDVEMLYPTVWLRSGSGMLRANFGLDVFRPFVYSFPDHVAGSLQLAGTALDIPPEVIRHILSYLARPLNDMGTMFVFEDALKLQAYKRTIGTCSLTCRYWRQLLRPYLYHAIILRSGADLRKFYSAMCTAPANVHSIQIWDTGRLSWHHQLYILAPAAAYNTKLLRFMGRGLSPTIRAADPPMLSRSLPTLFSRLPNIESLYVHNHLFTSFQEVARIIDRLPHLRNLIMRQTSWPAKSTLRRITCSNRHLKFVNITLSPDNFVIISLALASPDSRMRAHPDNSNPSGRPLVHPASAKVIMQVCTCFFSLYSGVYDSNVNTQWSQVGTNCASYSINMYSMLY